jgi:hypothetical protein
MVRKIKYFHLCGVPHEMKVDNRRSNPNEKFTLRLLYRTALQPGKASHDRRT